MATDPFRLVVRGNQKDGTRVRRVRVQHSVSYEQAWHDFSQHYEDMSAGLTNPAYSVLPPVGYCVDGSLSIGCSML